MEFRAKIAPKPSGPIDASHTQQYEHLIDEWVDALDLRPREYARHALRRPEASTIYNAKGNVKAIQSLFGHSKVENTLRYFGVDIEDALPLAEKTETLVERGASFDRASDRFCSRKSSLGNLGKRQRKLTRC